MSESNTSLMVQTNDDVHLNSGSDSGDGEKRMQLKTIPEYWKTCGRLHGGEQEGTGRGRIKNISQVSGLNDLY